MAIDQITTFPDRNQDPVTYVQNANGMMAAIPVMINQINAATGSIGALAAGTAFSIPFVFSTITTDSDPSPTFLRLDNATQNAATTIRLDPVAMDLVDWSAVIATFTASTSVVKGQIRLVKAGDATKWMAFSLTAIASPTGYKNLTVAVVGSSSANPFANGDTVILCFTRTGDIGTTTSNTAFTPVAIAASNIDCSLGNFFTDTVAGAKTYTFSNIPAGGFSFTVEVQLDSGSVAWPASVKLARDQSPTLAAGKTHLFMLVTKNGGTRFRMTIADNFTN